ncbi:hypothetical protein DENSPDRAFT_876917 [Dentipellis sp. KUC8613]|nr:hypothetical protein DENSPDRAFT_876917 [Dentipellis sp. KUC8613]
MFSAFRRTVPQLSIFHNSASPPSIKALAQLQSALTQPFPPGKPNAKPLKFDLDVVQDTPPTADQIRTIMSYLPTGGAEDPTDPQHVANFLSSHPSSPSLPDRPHNAEGLARLAAKNPHSVKWPIIVDWTTGHASVGDPEGASKILEILRKRRDGEIKDEDDYKPKGWFS